MLYPALALLICIATPALAYVGPGPGLTALGSVVGFVAAIVFALAVVIAYPFRLLWRKLRTEKNKDAQ